MKLIYTLSAPGNGKSLRIGVNAMRDMFFEAGKIAYGSWWRGAVAYLRSLPCETHVSVQTDPFNGQQKTIVEYDFWLADEYVGRLLIDVFKVKLAQGRARAEAEKLEIHHA